MIENQLVLSKQTDLPAEIALQEDTSGVIILSNLVDPTASLTLSELVDLDGTLTLSTQVDQLSSVALSNQVFLSAAKLYTEEGLAEELDLPVYKRTYEARLRGIKIGELFVDFTGKVTLVRYANSNVVLDFSNPMSYARRGFF